MILHWRKRLLMPRALPEYGIEPQREKARNHCQNHDFDHSRHNLLHCFIHYIGATAPHFKRAITHREGGTITAHPQSSLALSVTGM